jgi:hypothetical protein
MAPGWVVEGGYEKVGSEVKKIDDRFIERWSIRRVPKEEGPAGGYEGSWQARHDGRSRNKFVENV